jgi:hypothetical protein
MKLKLLRVIAMLAGATLYQGGLTAAKASPVTYSLVGVTATFTVASNPTCTPSCTPATGTDTFTGGFTFDATTDVLDSVGAGTYANPGPSTGLSNDFGALNGPSFPPSTLEIFLIFNAPLDGTTANDPLTVAEVEFLTDTSAGQIAFQTVTANGTDGTSIAGDAVVTPIPATLPLLASGLSAMGLLGWRRKRKAQAAV